jgi:hypothetical protein
MVVNALSRCSSDEIFFLIMSIISTNKVEEIKIS